MIKGIDVSYWQGNINFNSVKNDGIDFAIIRSSYKFKEDSKLARNIKGFNEVGIKVHGIYHFSYAHNSDGAIKEAKFAIGLAEKYNLPKDTVIFYDFEYDTVDNAKKYGVNLTPSDCQNFTKAFCGEIEKAGYKAGVYFNIDFYKNWYQKNIPENCVAWLADYTGEADYPCDYQQYSSKGSVRGIDGDVDMNYYFERGEDMAVDAGKKVTAKEVIEVAERFLGYNEYDGSHKKILDIYNSHEPLARGYKMTSEDSWCDCFVSTVAILANAVDLIGTEVGCAKHIEIFKKLGIWHEDGTEPLQKGDIVVFNWNDYTQPNDYGASHIGYIAKVDGDWYTSIEGNRNDRVMRRTFHKSWGYIRGFARPNYAPEKDSPENKSDWEFEIEKAVKWAKDNKISDCLRLDKPITRKEAITMLYRMSKIK